jgi:hypothetical protein
VANLQAGGGATGGVKLGADVLDPDGATDTYRPKAGRDLFFVEPADTFAATSLPAADEQVIVA